MQVNSVSADVNFKQAYRPSLEEIANYSDKDIRRIAYKKAGVQVNDKRHQKLNTAMIYSIPVVAGLAKAFEPIAKTDSAVKLLGSRFSRLSKFAKTTAGWAAAFLAIDAVFAAKKFLDKKSSKIREFSDNNPTTSILGTIAAAFGAMIGVQKGGAKLISLLQSKIKPEKQIKTMETIAKKLNANKVLNKAADLIHKAPASLKSIGRSALAIAPLAIVLGTIAHQVGHDRKKAKVADENYEVLKGVQQLAKAEVFAEKQAEAFEAELSA